MRRGVGRREPNTADKLAELSRQDRRAKVLTLTVDGLSVRAIARLLGVSKSCVEKDLNRAVVERGAVTKEQSRAVATERLEAIVKANMADVRGDSGLARRRGSRVVMSAIALDARINGYAAPKQYEVSGRNGGPISFEDIRAMDDEQLAELAAGAWAPARRPDGGSGAGTPTAPEGGEPDAVRPDAEPSLGGAAASGTDSEGSGADGDGAG